MDDSIIERMSLTLEPLSSSSSKSHDESAAQPPKIVLQSSRTSLARIQDPEQAYMHQRMSRSEERLDQEHFPVYKLE